MNADASTNRTLAARCKPWPDSESAACFTVLLAACTAPHWEKTGAAPDDLAGDLKLCEASAPVVQHRPAPGPRSKPGSNVIDFNSASERSFDRARKDEEHIAACMRAKGYSR
jgi:hypothetical protein